MVDTIHDKIFMVKNQKNESWNDILEKADEIIESSKSYNHNKILNTLTKHFPSIKSPEVISQISDFKRVE